jgi:ammonia channel protein AmtB
MDQIPGLSLKASDDAEEIGMDSHELGELAYNMERDP